MLGERIAQLRKEKGLSQYDMADRLGFSRGKLANYEQGSRQPDYESLEKIADFFEVTTDYLLGRTNKKDESATQSKIIKHEEEKEIEEMLNDPEFGLWFKELKGSPEENREKALEFLRFLNDNEKDRKPRDKNK